MTKWGAIYSTIIRALFTGVFFLTLSLQTQAQTPLELLAPLDIPLILSGNFGEFRGSHFHTGIDIKTQGKMLPIVTDVGYTYMRSDYDPDYMTEAELEIWLDEQAEERRQEKLRMRTAAVIYKNFLLCDF